MDAIIKKLREPVSGPEANDDVERPSRAEAEEAVKTLIRWAGDNPGREGLRETPRRVAKAYEEFFAGYSQDPRDHLAKTFTEVEGYDDLVVVRDIDIESHCEHHMVPIVGMAHVAYLPAGRVVGLSKLARVVEIYARRLQTQETMTAQIADAIEAVLEPRGVAVMIDAAHQCMTTRGANKKDSFTVTTQFRGAFLEDERLERRFFELVRGNV
jgi:GTP cyclohydrolase I